MEAFKKNAPLLVIGLLLFCGIVSGCSTKKNEGKNKDKEKRAAEAVPVEVTSLGTGPIEATWRSSTSLEAEAEVQVMSQAANRVVELFVEEGDIVKKDQLLLRLENDIQKIARDKAQNNYDKVLEEHTRQAELFKQKLVSEEIFKQSQYNLRQLELDLADAKRSYGYTEVLASIEGTVSQRMVKLGDYVTTGAHLFDIVDFNSLVARVYPPEKYLAQIKVRQNVRVESPSLQDKIYKAFVKRISPVVLATTGTFKVTVAFEDVADLRPGMYVDVDVVLATFEDALLVPKRALVYDGDQTFVYRLGDDRTVERLLVDARLSDSVNVTPVSGLSVGDQIVIAGQTGLKDGAKVRLPGDPKVSEEDDETEKKESSKVEAGSSDDSKEKKAGE